MTNRYIVTVILSFFVSTSFAQRDANPGQKLNIANQMINALYVDDVDENKIVENAIKGMLEELDPHSNYMTVEEVKELNEPLQGNFDGIGIQFNMYNDTLYVIQTIVGGPSEKVGLQAGDRIISVNDSIIAGVKMSTNDIMKRLRGKKGTTVKVTVLRKNVKDPIPFKIVRDKIPIYSIDAAYMADKNTGYIYISRFASTTHKEFEDALKKLQSKGMKNLIIDLQGNGGGYLNAATEIADELLKKGELIVYTEGRKSPRRESNATSHGNFENGKLVILIDESSASASEIVSGAIQDWDRGVIVGRRSFGKGLVQQPLPLPDGSMIRLTTARYYTPAGRSIQKPYTNDKESYNKDLITRYNNGELVHADSIHFPDSLQFKTLINGRTVYGGGGIMPDMFVPIDTSRVTDYHRNIIANRAMLNFNTSYIDEHRQELNEKYKKLDSFLKSFEITDEMFKELIATAEKEGVKFDEKQFEKSKKLIGLQLKALIARDLFDSSAYVEVINQNNDAYNEGLRIINDNTLYNKLLHQVK